MSADTNHRDNIEIELTEIMSSEEPTETSSESEQEVEHPLKKEKKKIVKKVKEKKEKKDKKEKKEKKEKSDKKEKKEDRPTIQLSALQKDDWIDYTNPAEKLVRHCQFKSVESEDGKQHLLLKKGKRIWLVDKNKITNCYRSTPPEKVAERQRTTDLIKNLQARMDELEKKAVKP
jgi:hypothetical protein